MNNEPQYSAQCGEPLNGEQQLAWAKARLKDAFGRGTAWHRYSAHPTIPHLILFEGWRQRPAEEPPPRWHLVAGNG